MAEWLLIDKVGDFFYYNKVDDIIKDTGLSKSQINNIFRQSLKHYNKYTNKGLYIQRLFNDTSRPPRQEFIQDKYIYYEDHGGNKEYGVIFNK